MFDNPGEWADWIALVAFLVITFGTAAIGAIWTESSVDTWYARLKKPLWNPPSRVFAPVWTVLYLFMASAAWMVWRVTPSPFSVPILWYLVQLFLNGIWPFFFFKRRSPGAGFVCLMLLLLALTATMVSFFSYEPAAAWLLLPYLAWILFAAALNLSIWLENE